MDHRAEAEKYLRIDAETENSALGKDALGRAEVHALLDVADAIREQTEALSLGGIRDDLGEIGHAIRSRS